MNRTIIVALSLWLSACVSTPDLRPEPYLKSEELLQQGLAAYQNDNFSLAAQKFSRALELYQSFDNQRGMGLARLNLVETALANSDFAKASSFLKQLKQQVSANSLDEELKREVSLLEVKLQFEQQHYQAALVRLQPLLAELDEKKPLDTEQLNLLAMQARLEVLISPLGKSDGLSKFETALAKMEPAPPHYQIMLKRILAITASQRGDYSTATHLLKEALAYYQTQANRRSIASCLEELANIETAQRHESAAQDYLNRALLIRQWLKNDYKTNKIRQQLQLEKK
jgi:hypothetical protein